MYPSMRKDSGFTLIEIIVTLIVASILGTIVATFMGSTLTGSVQPLIRVQQAGTAGKVMENITTDFNKLNSEDYTNGTTIALATLKARIDARPATTLYGANYVIVHNDYVVLNSDGTTAPAADGTGNNRTLRVSITQGSQTLTTLFTK
jgi:prepilin-type N-terminal cleavage/methylation domain-containing protein